MADSQTLSKRASELTGHDIVSLCLGIISTRSPRSIFFIYLAVFSHKRAVNRVTLEAQKQPRARRQSLIEVTPPILIVDGVWIDILYTRMGVQT